MRSVLPLVFDAEQTGTEGLPLCRETDWDFTANQPVWRDGSPVFVTGQRAVLIWAWNALHTERFAHDVYSSDYGPDFSALLGQSYAEEIRQSEAIRIVRETLLVNPYITGVSQVSVAEREIPLTASVTLVEGYTVDQVGDQLEAAVNELLSSQPFGTTVTIPFSRFLACLLQCPGVADYSAYTVDGASAAVTINAGDAPVVGTITIT